MSRVDAGAVVRYPMATKNQVLRTVVVLCFVPAGANAITVAKVAGHDVATVGMGDTVSRKVPRFDAIDVAKHDRYIVHEWRQDGKRKGRHYAPRAGVIERGERLTGGAWAPIMARKEAT